MDASLKKTFSYFNVSAEETMKRFLEMAFVHTQISGLWKSQGVRFFIIVGNIVL